MANETPRIAIVDCTTGETIEREMNEQELADLALRAAEAERVRAIEEAENLRINALKESAKAKLIAGEALTAEEASVIVL